MPTWLSAFSDKFREWKDACSAWGLSPGWSPTAFRHLPAPGRALTSEKPSPPQNNTSHCSKFNLGACKACAGARPRRGMTVCPGEAALGSEMPADGTGLRVIHRWLSGTPGPPGFAGNLSPSSYPLVDVFAESCSLCLSVFSSLMLLMKKAVKPEKVSSKSALITVKWCPSQLQQMLSASYAGIKDLLLRSISVKFAEWKQVHLSFRT